MITFEHKCAAMILLRLRVYTVYFMYKETGNQVILHLYERFLRLGFVFAPFLTLGAQ